MRPVWLAVAVAAAAYAVVRRRKLNPVTLTAAGAVALAATAYGAGLLDLPNPERLLADIGAALGAWTYLLVGVGAFLETGAFVGLIAPGESLMVFGGFVAGQGRIDLGLLLAIVWAAAVAGDSVSFLLGRRLGRDFLVRHGPRMRITEERVEQVEAFFARHGGKTILIGRFVGLVRAVAPFVAGASRMPYLRFWPYDVLGAGLYAGVFVLLGYVFWQSFGRVVEYAGQGALALGTVIVAVTVSVSLTRRMRDPERRAATLTWVHRQPVLRRLGLVLAPVRSLVRRPARWLLGRLTPGELGLELTTLVAVLAIGAFAFGAYALELRQVEATPGDLRALVLADRLRAPGALEAARLLNSLGALGVSAAVTGMVAAVLLVRDHPVEAAVLVVALVLAWAAVEVAQGLVDRPAPGRPLVEVDEPGFPSTHAAYGMVYPAVALALARGVPALAGRFVVVALALALWATVSLAGVYLRLHFPSDVIAGAGLGAAAASLSGMAGLVVGHMRHTRGRRP